MCPCFFYVMRRPPDRGIWYSRSRAGEGVRLWKRWSCEASGSAARPCVSSTNTPALARKVAGMVKSWCLLLVLAATGGCAASGYWADRGRDAADVFSIAVGSGLGAKARIGPVAAGLLVEYTAAGLRGGEFCSQTLAGSGADAEAPGAVDFQLVVDNAERFQLTKLRRGKNFEASSLRIPLLCLLQSDASMAYYTQIEAVVALHGSLRAGINVGELCDFILGWAAVDILRDDVSRRPAATAVPAAGPPAPASAP